MFSTLRNRFGIPGVISVIALVFAMFGGAYAASNSSDGDKATASAKAKKGPRGPKGATGPAGPAGPAGPQGPTGPRGDTGAAGSNGAPGAPGESVKLSSPGGACPEGGTKLTVGASSANVCNGEEGQQGEQGEPWTAGGTLPPGATETGTYLIVSETGNGILANYAGTNISFPIPLAAPLDGDHVKFASSFNNVPSVCENPDHAGAAGPANPEASPGYLCVYQDAYLHLNSLEMEIFDSGLNGAGVAGATLYQEIPEPATPGDEYTFAKGLGTWAVTGAAGA